MQSFWFAGTVHLHMGSTVKLQLKRKLKQKLKEENNRNQQSHLH